MKLRFLMWILTTSLLLAGCITEPEILMSFNPNPVILKEGDQRIEGEFSIKVAGPGEMYVKDVVFRAVTEDGNTIFTETITVNGNIPGFGLGFSHEIWLPISYRQASLTDLDKLVIEVTGSRQSALVIDIQTKDG